MSVTSASLWAVQQWCSIRLGPIPPMVNPPIVIHHQEELTALAYRPLAPSDIGETESTLMASVNLNSLEHAPAAVFVGFLVM